MSFASWKAKLVHFAFWNLKYVHKGDLFWLPSAQHYSTVEQPRVCLLPSKETHGEETKVMLPHSSGDFITDVEQFFSITVTFKSISFSVFTVAWPNETVLQSKLRGPLLCSSGFLLWAGHKSISLPLPSFLAGNDLLNSLVKHPSDVRWQSSLLFSALNSFLHCLFLLQWNNPSCLIGFCIAKALFVYLPQYWNSNQSKFSILLYPHYWEQHKKSFLEFTKFCKGSCHLVCSCVYNSWVVVIIKSISELRK